MLEFTEHPILQACPEDKLYVPETLRVKVIEWAHNSPTTGHPRVHRTIEVLCRKYWWASLQADVESAVKSCSVCAISETPRQLPAGKLMPLPVPQRPWSYIAVDFVMDLLVSKGYMIVIFPLSSLSSALELAEVLLHAVFLSYGIPEDILSD